MTGGLWWSIVLGGGIGAGYGVAAFLTHRLAIRYRDQRFMMLVFGGMLLRMLFLLVVVGIVVALLPVRTLPFLVSLVTVLLVGLGVELVVVRRDLAARSSGAARA